MRKIVVILFLSLFCLQSQAKKPEFVLNTGISNINKAINNITTKKINIGITNEIYNNTKESIDISTIYSIDVYNNNKIMEDIKWLASIKKTIIPNHTVFFGGNISLPLYVNIDGISITKHGYGIHLGYIFNSSPTLKYKLMYQSHQYKTNRPERLIMRSITAGIVYSI
jgi:hypothetical protein